MDELLVSQNHVKYEQMSSENGLYKTCEGSITSNLGHKFIFRKIRWSKLNIKILVLELHRLGV